MSQNYFSRLNNSNTAGAAQSAATAQTKPARGSTFTTGRASKKTLKLNSGSRRKVRGATLTSEGNNTLNLGKRIRSQSGRRIGSQSTAKTFKCHLDTCAKVFNDRASLKKHMTVHGDKLVSINEAPASEWALNLFCTFLFDSNQVNSF